MHALSTVDHSRPSIRRILDAAGRCFGREGFKGASLSLISKEAGVSKSLLHYHFDSKEHLFLEVQLQFCRDLLGRVQLVAEGSGSVAAMLASLDEVFRFIERDRDQIFVLLEFRNVVRDNAAAAEQLDRFLLEMEALLVVGLETALGADIIGRLTLPAPRLARLLRVLFEGLVAELALTEAARGRDAITVVRETYADFRALLETALLGAVLPAGPPHLSNNAGTRSADA